MSMHEVRGQFRGTYDLQKSRLISMDEVRGWDFSLEVKTQLKVTHAQELTSDLMQTHRDLTG